MRGRSVVLQLVMLALLLMLPAGLIAQEALTQTYTSPDGVFTISYPDGWTAEEEDDFIQFNSDQAFLQISYRDYGEEVTPLEVLEIGTPAGLGFSPPEQLIIAGYAALQSGGTDQLHTIINFCEGMMALAIGFVPPGQVEAYTPMFMAMLESIRFGEGEPQVCRGAFEGFAPVTVANAAQVAQIATLGDETVPVTSVIFSPDGGQLAAGTQEGDVWRWSTVTGEALDTLTGHRDGATSLAYNESGFNLAVGTGRGEVRMWDATRGDSGGTMQEHDTAVESVAFSGFLIASGSLDGEVRLWDMISASERAALVDAANPTPVASVAFSPDGTLLAAGGGSTIRLWNVESGTVQAVLETEISDIASLSFRPDGTALIYGGADSAAWLWDLAGDNHALLDGHSGTVSALAYSPDGQVIASGDSEAVRLWDANTGTSLATLTPASAGVVNSLAFSPDGSILASGGDTGGVVIWGTSSAGGQQAAAPDNTGGTTETTTMEETTASALTCTITAPSSANLRGGPGTNFDRAGSLSAGQTVTADGQTTGADGMTWYRLTDGAWVRGDVVSAPAECASVPTVTP